MHLYYVVQSKQKQPIGTKYTGISHSNTEDEVMRQLYRGGLTTLWEAHRILLLTYLNTDAIYLV